MMKTKEEKRLLGELQNYNGSVKYTHSVSLKKNEKYFKQTIAVIKINNLFYIGHSILSNKDAFNKKIGRVIALGRAMQRFKEKKNDPYTNLIIKKLHPQFRKEKQNTDRKVFKES